MRLYFLRILLTGFFCAGSIVLYAQATPPADPPGCNIVPDGNNNIAFSSETTTTYTFSTIQDMESTLTYSNNLVFTVKSKGKAFKVYVAGTITPPGGVTTTNIPLSNFQALVNTTTVDLSGSYQILITDSSGTSGNSTKAYNLTIKLKPLDTFVQAPGDYTLTLHFKLCQ